MVFGNGVKSIQAAAYNGARTVVVNFTYGLCEKNTLLEFCATSFFCKFTQMDKFHILSIC